jgi:RNA polymerase sigma-70 factor, ECF subfamily
VCQEFLRSLLFKVIVHLSSPPTKKLTLPVHAHETATADDSEWARRAAIGEQRAFLHLFNAHFSFVCSAARHLGTPSEEIEDVAQEVFGLAFQQIARFQHGQFKSWLYRITSNQVSNRHRARKVRWAFARLLGKAEAEGTEAADVTYERHERGERVAQVLAAMAHKKREVFAMYELEGLSGEEIADRLGCKIDTVWSRLHYARQEFESIARKRGLP